MPAAKKEEKQDVAEKETEVEAEAKEEEAKPKSSGPAKKSGKKGEEPDPLEEIVKLMEERNFGRAAAALTKLLKKNPDDPVVLHNLGCVYTEQEKWAEAEETFTAAFDSQKKAGRYNDATLFGLGTVLVEQGGMGKLMQAEALFRDCLDRAIAKEEHGIMETYRSFQALGECLGAMKRWGEAVEAYKQGLDMGLRMFAEDHPRNQASRAMVARAERLARLQKYMRIGLWTATAAVPVFCALMWNYVGGPSPFELIHTLTGYNMSASSAVVATLDLPDDVRAPHGGEF